MAPHLENRLAGSAPYVMWVAFATTCVTSSMFVTALAPNLLGHRTDQEGHRDRDLPWTDWFTGFLPVGGPLLIRPPAVARLQDLSAANSRECGGAAMGGALELPRRSAGLLGRMLIMAGVGDLRRSFSWIAGGRLDRPHHGGAGRNLPDAHLRCCLMGSDYCRATARRLECARPGLPRSSRARRRSQPSGCRGLDRAHGVAPPRRPSRPTR